MTQEQKDLLFKDLCARLPYNVKIKIKTYEDIDEIDSIGTLCQLNKQYFWILEDEYERCIEYNKPYLFPLSSMSEDQKYEFYLRFIVNDCDFDYFKFYLDNGNWHKLLTSIDDIETIIDWFHKNHIDWRGLIPMGLANDATGLNIY